jgi:hypothetical protein
MRVTSTLLSLWRWSIPYSLRLLKICLRAQEKINPLFLLRTEMTSTAFMSSVERDFEGLNNQSLKCPRPAN